MKYYIFLILLFLVSVTGAQNDTPVDSPTVVMNATIHCGDGRVIENGLMAFYEGKITFLADARLVKFDFRGYRVIDAAGKHVYPGLIALNSQLGLREIEMVRSTNDQRETGYLNPNVRSVIAYNTDSRVIPTVRSNGILLAQIVPQGGRMPGTSSVMKLDGWNWEDAVYALDNGLHLNWPGYMQGRWNNGFRYEPDPDYENKIQELVQLFSEARVYEQQHKDEPVNLKLEAIGPVFQGEKQLFIRANKLREISNAVAFAESFGIRPIIVGGEESWMMAAELASKEIPVVLEAVDRLPVSPDEHTSGPYELPAVLTKNGVTCAISVSNDGSSFWNMRNLPFQAGTAAGYGLSKEEALTCITLNPARILGIDDHTGSLDLQKDATFLISEGDLLDMRSSKVIQAFIQGQEVELHNWQEALFNKFRKKYGLTD